MITLLTVLGCIVFTIFCINIGYRIALSRFNPKDLLERLEKISAINSNLEEGIKKLDETGKANTQWYFSQLQYLGQYLKDKHNDNYVFDRMGNIEGFITPEPKEYNLDDILDKISKEGFESLSDDERNYLKNQQ